MKKPKPGQVQATLSSPSQVANEIERQAGRLLILLGEADTYAERHDDRASVTTRRRGVSIETATVPAAALAPLLSAGTVECRAIAGRPRFTITEAGRMHLRRQMAGDDPFASQHRDLAQRTITRDGQTRSVTVNEREDPLHWLRRHRGRDGSCLAGPAAFEAGDRLRRDLHLAQALPKVTSNWSRMVVDGTRSREGLHLSERALAAKSRVEKAFETVGPDFAGLLVDVCGFSKGLEAIERERNWPLRSAKVVLSLALNALARHYGLGDLAQGSARAAISQWGETGYRPGA